jgi:hypothetical protein
MNKIFNHAHHKNHFAITVLTIRRPDESGLPKTLAVSCRPPTIRVADGFFVLPLRVRERAFQANFAQNALFEP